MLRAHERRNDREVVRDLRVVENAPIRLYPFAFQDFARESAVGVALGERFHRRTDGRQVVLRQRARIGARIRERLMLFVERLCERERRARGEAETAVRLALEARQVVEQRRDLRRGLRFFGDDARLAFALAGERTSRGLAPQPFGTQIRIVVLFLECFVEPATRILAALTAKRADDFPVIARHERPNLFFALNQDRERRRLDAAHGRQLKATGFGVERGHRARAVDADKPIGFRTADGGIGEWPHCFVGAQRAKRVAYCGRCHRLEP